MVVNLKTEIAMYFYQTHKKFIIFVTTIQKIILVLGKISNNNNILKYINYKK